MLVLSRKRGQSITIGNDIVITVVRLGRGNVQIGIDAPGHVAILRQEIIERLLDDSTIDDGAIEEGAIEEGAIENHGLCGGTRERIGAR